MSENGSTASEESIETQDEERIKNNFREIGRRIASLFEAYPGEFESRSGIPPIGTVEHFFWVIDGGEKGTTAFSGGNVVEDSSIGDLVERATREEAFYQWDQESAGGDKEGGGQ